MSEYPLPYAPHCCRCDGSAGLQNPRIADRQFSAEIRTKRGNVRRVVIKREHHDPGAVDFRYGRHDYSPSYFALSSFAIKPPPRVSARAKVARIDIDPEEMGNSARNIDLPVVGDCKSVLQKLCEAVDAKTTDCFQPWRQKLADGEAKKRLRAGGNYPTNGDIHPLRLCEEIKNFMQREAILTVDGQEILNFGRQSIPTFVPGHRLNSGPFGTMGVGLPFAVGSKAAKPFAQSSTCMATARLARTRWSSTPRCGTNCRSCA
jgi:hypothetical protein